MNHKEFFDVLVGKPPAEVELEIEIRKREIRDMPNAVVREICLELIKENRLQDFLIMASIERISEINEKLIRYEISEHHRTKNLEQKKKKFKKKQSQLRNMNIMNLGT